VAGPTGPAGVPATATYIRTSFTATSGQTVFTVDYTVGFVEVYLNGVLLNAADYTASNGTSVVLFTGVTAGTIIETIAYTVATVVSSTGPTGPTGPAGTSGSAGSAGPTGAQGAQGPTGPTGAQGAQGIQGVQGIQGNDGPTGPTGSASTTPGPTGPAGTAATTTYTRTSFTASAAQATFTVAYEIGFVEVYQNGVFLNGSDYTATNGTSVVLATPATAGDIIETIAYTISNISITGPTGPQGTQGVAGPTGPTGPTGAASTVAGPTGPTGSLGPTGPGGVPATTTYTRTSFTATSNQTSFTVAYTVGYVEVYQNGVLLNASDYTASNGTSVVLAVGATTGDIVETIAYTVTSIGTVGKTIAIAMIFGF
jgi:hypothetical protein